MSERITLRVTMELLSDAIFGSGFSVPGGEDIAVCTDGDGLPYLKGSTFKGLLRESLENWLCWTGGTAETLNALMGESGRNGTDDGRRIHLTALTAELRDPEACFSERAFTALENGTAKAGTLRLARCVRSGLRFTGRLECRAEDRELIEAGVKGIKWAGTMRSRGFGRVKCSCLEEARQAAADAVPDALCLHYRLRTVTPVIITDLSRSSGNGYETRGLIPGSAIRGMVMSELARREPEWFSAHRRELLGEGTRFLDALPAGEEPVIPSIKGFYEDKEETSFVSVLKDGELKPGMKRAKLGQFCSLRGDAVRYRSAATDGATRIGIGGGEGQTQMFQTRSISAGQEFEGYVLIRSGELSGKLSACLTGTVWLGADRYAGFGQCAVTLLERADAPAWQEYGYASDEAPGETVYLLAVSPFCMRDETGEPCGLDLRALAEQLEIERMEVVLSSTSVAEYGGFNRTWGCRESALRMYDRGSVFKLRCSPAPKREALDRIMDQGLGVRLSEGFGQVLFLSPSLFEGLRRKERADREEAPAAEDRAVLRRAKYAWLMENAGVIAREKLSPSQRGSLQAQCERALAEGKTDGLLQYLEKNLSGRGAEHGDRYKRTAGFVRGVLDRPLAETLAIPCEDDAKEKLRLLIRLFDFSRKGEL